MKKYWQLHKSLKLVADESVDFRIVQTLREAGFEVIAICELSPSITDKEVLQIAYTHKVLLITEDKDFGELVFRLQLPHNGILLIRIEDNSFKIKSAVQIIKSHLTELIGRFSVLTKERLRIKEQL